MANFTQAEAKAVTITYDQPRLKDGVHECWVFNVVCHDGYGTQWLDYDLASTATSVEAKSAIVTYMMTQEKCVATIPVYSEGTSLGIRGETAAPIV